MGAIKLSIEVSGLKTLMKMLDNPEGELYGPAWRKGMEDIAAQGGASAERGAPRDAGQLAGSISVDVQKRLFPQWAAIRVKAVRRSKAYPSGFSYPRLLAFSPKHGHRDWLINAVAPIWNNADKFLERIGQEIARQWGRG